MEGRLAEGFAGKQAWNSGREWLQVGGEVGSKAAVKRHREEADVAACPEQRAGAPSGDQERGHQRQGRQGSRSPL